MKASSCSPRLTLLAMSKLLFPNTADNSYQALFREALVGQLNRVEIVSKIGMPMEERPPSIHLSQKLVHAPVGVRECPVDRLLAGDRGRHLLADQALDRRLAADVARERAADLA